MTKPYITQLELKERLHYDPETGAFAWREQQKGTVSLDSVNGCPVGTLSNGRIVIGLQNRIYTASRLAWLYVYGELPKGNLRHRDNNPLNVAIKNLYLPNDKAGPRKPRTVDDTLIFHKGRFKVRGVTEARGHWVARPTINGKRVYLGQFPSQKEAEKAVRNAVMGVKPRA